MIIRLKSYLCLLSTIIIPRLSPPVRFQKITIYIWEERMEID